MTHDQFSEKHISAAVDFLNRAEARFAAEEWENSTGAVVMTRDLVSGYTTITGPYTDPVEALRHAGRVTEELSRDEEAESYEVTVQPLWSPEPL